MQSGLVPIWLIARRKPEKISGMSYCRK